MQSNLNTIDIPAIGVNVQVHIAAAAKELDTAARKREQADVRYRTELQALHVQLGDLRQQAGVLEGNLASVQVAHARDADDLARTREQLAMSRASADTRRQTSPTNLVAKRKAPRTPRSSSSR
jgi:septal ring factor EnvC (AmiA/AmiB activator)